MFRKRSYICVFLQFGNTQRFEIWALNSTKMRLAAGLRPDRTRWGSYCHFSPAFDAPLGGPRPHIAITFGVEKPEWWFVSTQYERDRYTDRWTPHVRRNRPRLHSITRQYSYKNLYKTQNAFTRMFNASTIYSEIFSSQSSDKILLDFFKEWA